MCGPITARSAWRRRRAPQCVDPRVDHAGREAAPARVDRGHGAAVRARGEHGHAVGRDHADRIAVRSQITASASTPPRALLRAGDARAVHLTRPQQRRGRRVAARAEAVTDAARVQERMFDHRRHRTALTLVSRRSSAASARREVGGQLGLEAHALAARGMDEAEHARVQRGAVEAGLGAVAAAAPVDGIARDRQPDRREVHADLMRAPGLRAAPRAGCARCAGSGARRATPCAPRARRCAPRSCACGRADGARSRRRRGRCRADGMPRTSAW